MVRRSSIRVSKPHDQPVFAKTVPPKGGAVFALDTFQPLDRFAHRMDHRLIGGV